MPLRLKVLTGPLTNQTFAVVDGLVIGRQNATINLNDRRVSSRHASVVSVGAGWRLLDEQSKNGIRDAQGNKMAQVDLRPGARFTIGESDFEVISPAETHKPEATPAAERKSTSPKKRKQLFWHEALAKFLTEQAPHFRDQPKALDVLKPALVLAFARGPQVNTRWILGFGPREIGAASLDLPLWEPEAPAVCFKIQPSAEGLEFTTVHAELVRVNGQPLDRRILAAGDTIQIRETLIEVDFTE